MITQKERAEVMTDSGPPLSTWGGLCRAGGIASMLLVVYSLATIVQIVVLGGQPTSAAEAFKLLQTNKIVGLLRLDLPSVFVLPLYYFLFLGSFVALQHTDRVKSVISLLLVLAGVTLVLATPTGLSMLALSEKHAHATTDSARLQIEAAGEALLASDIWHGTGAIMGGILTQIGAVLISIVMLRTSIFSKAIAWIGILMHGVDLAHILVGPFSPKLGGILMMIAGPFYPVWLFLVGRRLLQLASVSSAPRPT